MSSVKVFLELYLILLSLVDCRLIVEKINLNENKAYLISKYNLVNADGKSVISMTTELVKTWNHKLIFYAEVHKRDTLGYHLILRFPKLNYCDITRFSNRVPLFLEVMNQLNQYGNLSLTCPLYSAAYYLNNFYIDDRMLPMTKILSHNTHYMAKVMMKDENAKRPVVIFNNTFEILYLRD